MNGKYYITDWPYVYICCCLYVSSFYMLLTSLCYIFYDIFLLHIEVSGHTDTSSSVLVISTIVIITIAAAIIIIAITITARNLSQILK